MFSAQKKLLVPALAFSLAWLAGCSTYPEKAQEMRDAWARGKFENAEKIARAEAFDASKDDQLVWELDFATALRACGKIADSQDVFDGAAKTVAEWDEQPDILISSEASATLLNLTELPYRGRASDRIMLHTYRALNFLELARPDEARVALNAAFKAQTDAVERNEKEIRAAQESAKKNNVSVDSLENDKSVSAALAKDRAESAEIAVYGDYVNPFSTWLHGVYFMHAGDGASDLERARKSLERVAKMVPQNKFVKDDLADCDSPAKKRTPLTYVIFEYGLAPNLVVSRTDLFLPIPTGNGTTIAPVSIALPKLSRISSFGAPPMTANSLNAQMVCDMNSVVKTDFENAYPVILSRTLTTAFVKTAASAASGAIALQAANSDDGAVVALVALAVYAGTSIFAVASADADVRAWQTLPENFSLVRLATPGSRKVRVSVAGRDCDVALLPGTVNVIFVKSAGPGTAPVVSQFVLKK